MIDENDYNPKEYLKQLTLNEGIISGNVPMEILSFKSKELWLINFELGKSHRSKLLKAALFLVIDEPKKVRTRNSPTTAISPPSDSLYRHLDKDNIIDKGSVYIKSIPAGVESFDSGVEFEIFNFKNMKSLKSSDKFHINLKMRKTPAEDSHVTITKI